MTKLIPVLVLASLCPLSRAQAGSVRSQASPPCSVTEASIFKEARICGKMHEGGLTKADLTVAGLTVSESTLEDVEHQFPTAKRFRLTKGEEATVGLCVKDERGNAIVFGSGTSGGWKVLDSIYMAEASAFERQGAKCSQVASLPTGASTQSGIQLGMEKERVLSLLGIAQSHGANFEVDYGTSPEKAPWLSASSRPSGEGWVAMSGAYGGFREGRLRWVVLYAGLSD